MNSQELEKNAQIIKSELEREVISGDIDSVQEKLIKLTSLTGLSAECMRNAKANLLHKQQGIIHKNKGTLPPSILTKLIESECWEEEALLTYFERLGSGITHSIDGLRSVMSLYKTELENSMKG